MGNETFPSYEKQLEKWCLDTPNVIWHLEKDRNRKNK